MDQSEIKKLDNLFISYNYKVSNESNNGVRIYTLRYGMYHAAELVLLNPDSDPKDLKSQFSDLGYATEVRNLLDIQDIEKYLFEGFFIKTPLGSQLRNRYKKFVNKQIENLPEGSEYKYIRSPFKLIHRDYNATLVEAENYEESENISLIEKINKLISNTEGALFIVIEAAAGFGKTCTAYEILNTFSTENNNQLPFFTELSRNREARIFKHILLKEIDEQFPNGIKQNIVIDQITKGRIPLIIDGFDELITKESNKEEVESMLSTIMDLLKDKAKIVITSRKTAIFNSNEFIKSINTSANRFSFVRIEIEKPTIYNWLSEDRIKALRERDFPLTQIANPVLLSYLRNISEEKFRGYLNEANSTDKQLITRYIDFLLQREQKRQNIKLGNEEQLRIFRKLVRLMTEFNITAESKETIKELIKDYNIEILRNSLKNYFASEKPSIEDLVETLSNHVFLDRKPNGDIGFVNDFIFGLLVAENLISGKYEKYYPNIAHSLPEDFAIKATQSFKIQNKENQKKLWNKFNDLPFSFSGEFFFDLDYSYLKEFKRDFNNLYLNNYKITNMILSNRITFSLSGFYDMEFRNCTFFLESFTKCTFNNCSFYDCKINLCKGKEFNDFSLFACKANNKFIQEVEEYFSKGDELFKSSIRSESLSEIMILREFFDISNTKPRAAKLSQIRDKYSAYSYKETNKIINNLQNKGFLHFDNDIGFLTKDGISYFNKNKPVL